MQYGTSYQVHHLCLLLSYINIAMKIMCTKTKTKTCTQLTLHQIIKYDKKTKIAKFQ